MKISSGKKFLRDEFGRRLILRGVNLGGSTKVPVIPDGATHLKEGFYDTRDASFIGRPFPVEEADEHFARLKSWGLDFIRLLTTWEAIEHAGPGIYDEAYLDYLEAIVEKAAPYHIKFFIDPHQDVWSRWTGGDGAPAWLFEKLGMDITRLHSTGAAFTHQEHGDPYPRMVWSSNYTKYAAATMFTLFFGGNDFAPKTLIDGVPAQEYLQGHYIDAVKQVASRMKRHREVVGYDTFNEPSPGYIGAPDVDGFAADLLNVRESPRIFEGILAAAGYTVEVENRSRLPIKALNRRAVINPRGESLYLPGFEEIWKANGVWELDEEYDPILLSPDHFARVKGRQVTFLDDYFLPFVERYTGAIREAHPGALIFVSPAPNSFVTGPDGVESLGVEEGIVYAPHWYDEFTLVMQRYVPWLGLDTHGGRISFTTGRDKVRAAFAGQIAREVRYAAEHFNDAPVLIGEFGLAFNMDNKKAYKTGDFSAHVEAMDDSMAAMDANLVSFTLWNYTADNTNERGDLWNGEDLSIFSRDQVTGTGDINDGGRALKAVVRPYARRVPGTPRRMRFDMKTREFFFEFEVDPEVGAPLDVFVPFYQYPDGFHVTVTGGDAMVNFEKQILIYTPDPGYRFHTVRITPRVVETSGD